MDGLHGEAEKHRLRLDFRSTQRKNLQDSLGRQRKSLTSTFNILHLNPKKWSVDYSTRQVNRYRKVKVSLDKWFWRVPYTWYTFLQVALSLAASSFHFLCNGSLSMRALLSSQAFYGLQRPSFSGGLEEDPDSLTPSLISRLRSFFAALRRDREVFEAQPDVGLVGKPVQRIFFKLKATLTATFGSAMIVVFMVVGSALCTLLSGAVVVLSPGIALLCTLAMSISELVLYDRAMETSGLVWKLLTATYQVICPGILQAILATFRHVVFHPIVGSLHFVGSFVRFASRSLRDAMTGRVLSRFAKIPVGETFLAKRIRGPGVSSTHCYRLPLTAAKAAVEVVLQQALVSAHIRFRKAEVKEPFHRYDEFASGVLSPFGYRANLEINSPSRVCWKLVSRIQKESRRQQNDSTISFDDNTESLWEELNKRILGANPDSRKASQMRNIKSTGKDKIEEPTEKAYELKVREQVKYHAANITCDIHYDVMALRTGQLLAELWLLQEFRATRMSRVVDIPQHARGQFRLPESELQELWSFALTRTKLYADQLQSDLTSAAKESAFRQKMEDTSEEIFNSFCQADEAYGTRDTAFVASSLLSTLLGGDVMLESLEDTDKTLVIKPTYSEVDEHLVFWNSVV